MPIGALRRPKFSGFIGGSMVSGTSMHLSNFGYFSLLALQIAWAGLPNLVLSPVGELFRPSGAFRCLKVSGFSVSYVVIGTSRCFSYFGHFGLLRPLVCLDKLF